VFQALPGITGAGLGSVDVQCNAKPHVFQVAEVTTLIGLSLKTFDL